MAKQRASVKTRKAAPGPKQTHLNPDNVRPVFANWVQVYANNNEFRLIFGEVLQATPQDLITREMARVYMAPRVAKAMLAILAGGVEKFEKTHGPIDAKDIAGD